MAINNLTELVQVLEQDPTLASISVTRDGTSVTELRLNPIANGIQSTSQTSTVTVSPVTVPTIVDTVTVDNIADNDQGTTNEQLVTSIDGRLAVIESDYATKTYVDSRLDSKANIQDPTFFGTVNTDSIRIDNNVISTTVLNSDLELRASGTGKIIVDSIQIQGNTIGTTDSSGIEITESLRTYSALTVDDDLIVKGTILPLDNKLKIGSGAGAVNQQAFTIAVGVDAGKSNQGSYAVAIGFEAGTNQGTSTVAIGPGTAQTNQGNSAVAIGDFAANSGQGTYSVAIGGNAGQTNQTGFAVAVGPSAGNLNQGASSVGVGEAAGYSNQGDFAVAIGFSAARNGQGENAIALGKNAGYSNQHDNSIILNASGSSLNSDGTGRFFVKPVREVATGSPPAGFYQVYYNPTTGEFIYLS